MQSPRCPRPHVVLSMVGMEELLVDLELNLPPWPPDPITAGSRAHPGGLPPHAWFVGTMRVAGTNPNICGVLPPDAQLFNCILAYSGGSMKPRDPCTKAETPSSALLLC